MKLRKIVAQFSGSFKLDKGYKAIEVLKHVRILEVEVNGNEVGAFVEVKPKF